MQKLSIVALLLVLASGLVYAQDDGDIEAFNTAWSAYQTAMGQSDADVQIDAARDTLAMGRKIFPPSDARLPVLMSNYGVALFAGEHEEESREVLHEALDLSEAIHGKDSMASVMILSSLADAESDFKVPRRQLRYYKRALNIVASQFGEESDEYGDLAYRAGVNIHQYSYSQSGRKYLLQAQKIFHAKDGEHSLRSGLVTYHLGRIEFSEGHYGKAAEYILAAMPAFKGDEESQVQYQLYARALLVQAYEADGNSDAATEHCVAIGRISKLREDLDYQPLFRVAPEYPLALLSSGVGGHVDLSFTVDKNGFVRNVKVIDQEASGRPNYRTDSLHRWSEDDTSFEAAARKAVQRFRYAPKFVDGEAVEVDDIKTRISYEIED